MRENKTAIVMMILITVVSLFTCAIQYSNQNLIYDLSLACFGSALLGFVVASTAYMAERRTAMEQFYEEVRKAISILNNISIIEIPDIVSGALKDENSWLDTSENADKLKNYIEARLPIDENTTDEQINEWINGTYKAMLEDARSQIRTIAAAYLEFSEFDLSGLSNAYGRLDFLIGNDSIRTPAYQNLYDKLRVFRWACIDQSRAFKPYIDGHGNEIVCFDKIQILQNQIFEERDGAYYAKFKDDLEHNLETFRSDIYDIKPEYEKPYPVHYYIDFEDIESINRYNRDRKRVEKEGRDESADIYKI